jgi:hypothetical protein
LGSLDDLAKAVNASGKTGNPSRSEHPPVDAWPGDRATDAAGGIAFRLFFARAKVAWLRFRLFVATPPIPGWVLMMIFCATLAMCLSLVAIFIGDTDLPIVLASALAPFLLFLALPLVFPSDLSNLKSAIAYTVRREAALNAKAAVARIKAQEPKAAPAPRAKTPPLAILPYAIKKPVRLGITDIPCRLCGRGLLIRRSVYLFSTVVVVIGYMMLACVALVIAIYFLVAAGSIVEMTKGGIVAPMAGLAFGWAIFAIIGTFMSGVVGWLLIMKKKILQCGECGAVTPAS